jgi:DNA invertase Pin-like site-specific DNA recombinase
MPKNIAYLSVSTLEQDNAKNKTDILTLANEKGLGKVEFVEDKIYGKVSWKERQILRFSINSKKGMYF